MKTSSDITGNRTSDLPTSRPVSQWNAPQDIAYKNEYRRTFPEGGGRSDKLTPFNVSFVLKFGTLNLLGPSGHVQACNGDCFIFILFSTSDVVIT